MILLNRENFVMDFNQIINLFQTDMLSNGITPPHEIIADSQLHRFHIEGDKHASRNGWYILYPDGFPSGAFGNWKTGVSAKWFIKSTQKMTIDEKNQYHAKILKARQQRDKLQILSQSVAATKASTLWHNAKEANIHHPYLMKKRVSPLNIKQLSNLLLVPLIDIQQALHNLQMIAPNGRKRFLTGGRIKGIFSLLGELPTTGCLYICEGWATGMTIHTLTGSPVVAAMNAGNLKHVASALRTILPPEIGFIIAADNDRFTANNPGLTKGLEAAKAIGAKLIWPHFPCHDCDCTDFNDLYICEIAKGGAV